jgi:hypothetical protein
MFFMEHVVVCTEGYTKKHIEHRVVQLKDDIDTGLGRTHTATPILLSPLHRNRHSYRSANLNPALLCAAPLTSTINSILRYIFVWQQNNFYIHRAWLLKVCSVFRLLYDYRNYEHKHTHLTTSSTSSVFHLKADSQILFGSPTDFIKLFDWMPLC